jgi:hypothetical protein
MVYDAPPLAPLDETSNNELASAAPPASENHDIESVAAAGAHFQSPPPARLARSSARTLVLALGIAALLLGAAVGRKPIVRVAPQTAALFAAVGLPVNLRGLVFQHVKTTSDMQDGVPVLVVEGEIGNITGERVDVPRLRFSLRTPAGVEIYAWTAVPDSSSLAGGETLPFRSRLAAPPAGARDVAVRFFARGDLDPAR